MAKRIRSAKGEVVDFDILTIKAQIAAGKAVKIVEEPAVTIRRQENFIDKKTKRRIAKTKKTVDQVQTIDVDATPTSNK